MWFPQTRVPTLSKYVSQSSDSYGKERTDTRQEKEISAAYEKLKSLGAKVKNVVPASLDDLVVDGMSQIGRVMGNSARTVLV